MENKERLYKAIEYAKFGEDLIDDRFQLDDGKPYYCDRFNGINLSSLFSLLIKEAGRLCDHYASDMFYDLKQLYEDLYGDNCVLFEQEEYQTVIGIRESGVDGEGFMLSRMNSGDTNPFTYNYREIFLIKATRTDKGLGGKLSCYRVSPSSMDWYFERKEKYEKYGL